MEGPLVSDTTEFLSGAQDAPGETPLGRPASPVNADPEGSHAGSRAPAGSDGAAAAKGRRRQGTGLSALLLPELQQVAQQMGIAGTARMRKSQLIAAIQEKQGGGTAEEPRRGSRAGATAPEVSALRAASAGADASRPLKQDAMEPQTSTETGIRGNARADGNGVPASSRADAVSQQLSSDQASASDTGRAAQGSQSPQAAPETATETVRGDGQQPADGPRGDRRRRGSNSRGDAQQSRGRGDSSRDGGMAGTAKGATAARAATVVTAVTAASRPPRSRPEATSPTAVTTTATARGAAAAVTGSATAAGAASVARVVASPSRRSPTTTC